jgi:photosystem II stability/assembly factor-like uncharacterized protein
MNNILLIISITVFSFTVKAQSWTNINSGTQLKLNSISFGSNLIGYIGANDSTILKTIDGGLTWNKQATNGISFSLNLPDITQVDFTDELNGTLIIGLSTYSGQMFKTTDGGLNWSVQPTSMCTPIFSFSFDEDNAFAIGSSCFGGKTIEKKVNGVWDINTVYLSWGNEYLRTMTFYDNQFGIVAGDSGTVHRTMDGGLTWDTTETISDEIIWDLQFVNDSTIYGVVDSLSNTLMISTDSGSTWRPHDQSLTFFYPKLKALTQTPNEGIIGVGQTAWGVQGVILWGYEGGSFWRVDAVDQPLYDVTMSNDTTAFAVGDSGLIVMNQRIVLSVNQIKIESTTSIYPNPAIDHFSIKTNNESVQEVLIYDISGRLVKSTLSGFEYIDISNLKNGMYHVTILSDAQKEVFTLVVQ